MSARRLSLLAAAALALVAWSCSTSDAVRGARAERARDYAAARDAYRRELDDALRDDQGTEVARFRVLIATYELGRMTGYCCDYAEAERLLREALRRSELIDERFSHRTAILCELARLTFDAGKAVDSVRFYERATERLDSFQHVDRDPLGFALFLDDYADALEEVDDEATAARVRARAETIRSSNVGAQPAFTPLHYRDVCGQHAR